jgi:hypothetical protein
MSQSVANAKQFASTTKGKDVRSVLPTPSRPPLDLRQSAIELRKKKKLYKAGKGELDVEATQAKRDLQTAGRFGRYFDDTSIFSKQWTPEAMEEAEKVVGDFKNGPYADTVNDQIKPEKIDAAIKRNRVDIE